MIHYGIPGTRPNRRTLCALAILLAVIAFTHGALAQSLLDDLLIGAELAIGESVAQNMVTEYGEPVTLPPAYQTWVDTIFSDIVAQASRKEIPYRLYIFDTDVVNAFAAPGGHIFLTTGLLRHIGPDSDALANVLGHEVAHVEHRHGMNTLLRQMGTGLLLQLLFSGSRDSEVFQTVVVVATELMHLGFSREQEYESDDLGQRLAARAGYDPHGMVRFFNKLRELEGAEVPFLEFLQTHPLTSERAQRAQARAASLTVTPRPGGPIPAPPELGTLTPSRKIPRRRPVDVTHRPVANPSRIEYRDPAERFTLELPAGWHARPTLHYGTTRFDGPKGEALMLSFLDRLPNDTDAMAFARRILAEYADELDAFFLERWPEHTRLANMPAVYAEYGYTDSWVRMRAGSYFLLHGNSGIVFQFTAPGEYFQSTKSAILNIADTLVLGSDLTGSVSAETLRTWPVTVTHTVDDKIAVDISELWIPTWMRDPNDSNEPQLIEFTEIGGNGWLAVWIRETAPGTQPDEVAREWLSFLLERTRAPEVLLPVRQRRFGDRSGASFILTWEEQQTRWTHYAVTTVHRGYSYEVLIGYRADGFNARKPVFEAWLDSLRILQ